MVALEDAGGEGLAPGWADGPAPHAPPASTTTRAAAPRAPRICLSPSPREPVTNRLRFCCSGARADVIPLHFAAVWHAWSLQLCRPRHDDGWLRVRFGISGPYPCRWFPVKKSVAPPPLRRCQRRDPRPHAA